jgi:hypothetical protein
VTDNPIETALRGLRDLIDSGQFSKLTELLAKAPRPTEPPLWPNQHHFVPASQGRTYCDQCGVEVTLTLVDGVPVLDLPVPECTPVPKNEHVLTISPPDEYSNDWTIIGDLREIINLNGDSTNYHVAAYLGMQGWPARQLDPEFSCFFGHTTSEAEAERMRDAAEGYAKRMEP